MNPDLNPVQKVLLDTLKKFDAFCKDNGLRYYAAYGTLLGAIRHKGFIPWDDDIDVYMLRSDYNRLLALKDKLAATTDCRVVNYSTPGYPYNFAKFHNTGTTFWEYSQFPLVIGLFIDIFILDEWDADDPGMDKLYARYYNTYWAYRKSISRQTWREILGDIVRLNGLEGPVKLVKKLWYAPRRHHFLKKVEKLEREMETLQGSSYKVWADIKTRYYSKDWFGEPVEVSFEDTTIPVPPDYDACLRCDYGDYMTPPAEHERTGHPSYYMNLDRAMTIDEILREKGTEVKPRKRMSLRVMLDELRHRKGFD